MTMVSEESETPRRLACHAVGMALRVECRGCARGAVEAATVHVPLGTTSAQPVVQLA